MSSHALFKFIDASPAQTQVEKEHMKAEASAHAARISYQKRRRASDSKARSLIHRRSVRATVQPTRKSVSPSSMGNDQTRLSSIDSQCTNLSSTRSICECEYCSNFERFGAIYNYPATRPDWHQEDIVDLQFFIEILGSGVRNLSDSGFFNIVVPCLGEFDVGIRNLVLAVASAYRNVLSLREVDCRAADNRALEKCNKAIKSLSRDFALTPPEVSLTSCLLLATWYMFSLDPKAAATCTHAGENICHMDRGMRLKYRMVSARNATDPQASSNYQKSTFASIITGTVAKWGMDSFNDFQDLTATQDISSVRLDLSSDGVLFRIKDMHDLLSSVEVFGPLFQQLRINTSYHAHIDHKTSLAQDLLVRIDEIATRLREATIQSERTATAIGILWQWHHYYFVGIQCQILSGSEMSWDEYLDEFGILTELSEKHLSQMQKESSYVFLPVRIILDHLWFTAVHCRDPDIRSRAIAVLLKHHRNEAGLDSWFAGHVAQELMHLEEGSRNVRCASDIRECDRILLRGFESRGGELYLLYVYATEVEMSDANAIHRHPFTVPKDPHGVVQMWEQRDDNINHLHMLAGIVAQTNPETAPLGSFIPIYYDGEVVEVVLPEYSFDTAENAT